LKVRTNSRRLTIAVALLVAGGIVLSLYLSVSLGHSRPLSVPPSSSLVPILWESTVFNMSNGETAVQAATQFHANFIFRGTFQWGYTGVRAGPESSTPLFIKTSHSIKSLKQSNPHLVYEGGFGTQYLPWNATWVNGTAVSSVAFNSMVGKNSSGGWLQLEGYNGYIPDLASPTFRTYVVQWSERQIDEGVDGIFFDDPYAYAIYLVSVEHQDPSTVYNQYAGYMNGIVQVLKSYASTFGRAFFATINSGRCDEFQVQQQYPVLISFVSYVSCSPETGDFNATTNPSLQPMEDFAQLKASITATVNVPIMVFVDWPDQQNALSNLTAEQQITALTNLDHQVRSSGMLFVYDVFHHVPVYDSVSEGTYSTLLQLAAESRTASTGLETQSPLSIPVIPATFACLVSRSSR
jgi:hypothetical protein